MISSPLFSVMIEQKLNLATLIAAVIAVLAWVFPFPDIGEKDKNDKDNQQEKAPKRNYYLKYRIIVFLICMAALVAIINNSNTGPGRTDSNTPPPQEADIISSTEITPTPTPEITPTPSHEDTAQAGHQPSNAYQELLDKCLLFDSSLELPLESEMLDQTVIRYVEGSFPKSKSGGMYLCKSPGREQIALLKPHTPVTVHAVRGSLSESTGYAFVETGTGQFGWVAFQSTRGTGTGLAETNDF